VTVSLHNRRKLEVAIRCLLDGTVTPSDTKLTWKNVAAVAGVSKATADRAIHLRDEFRRQLDERVPPPTTRSQPGSRSRADADEEVARLRREHAELKETTKILHSVILALIQENQRLVRRRRRDDDGNIVPLTAPEKPQTSKC
jgi:transposase-like protein